jgi:hypothetical protein
MSDRDAIAVVTLLAGANWQANPLYVDAFLDRGKKGKEPRLHMLHVGPSVTPYAFPDTIDKPGSVAWNGFAQRPSTLMLAGVFALGGTLPFESPTNRYIAAVQTRQIMAWAKSHLVAVDRPWGRESQGCVAEHGWWYTQEGAFYLPSNVSSLPRVRDVLADPPKAHAWDKAALRAALQEVRLELRNNARLTVAYAHDTHSQSSAHQRLVALDGLRTGVASALQYTFNLRSYGAGRGAPAPGSAIAPTPVWIGDIDLPET